MNKKAMANVILCSPKASNGCRYKQQFILHVGSFWLYMHIQ